jgi:hypothetical protein
MAPNGHRSNLRFHSMPYREGPRRRRVNNLRRCFSALYVKLAALDFKLDTLSLPRWTFGSLFYLRIDPVFFVPIRDGQLLIVITQKSFSKAASSAVP